MDVASTDIERAAKFYSQLFGWEIKTLGPEAGGYLMFEIDGKAVAAGSPAQGSEMPSAWSLYFSTDDADATTTKVEAAGGKVVVAPMDVLDAGRMAVFQDNQGAFFSVWQPKTMKGFDVKGVANSYMWTDLGTNDEASAKAFYPKVFGWGIEEQEMPKGRYTQWMVDGAGVGGINPLPSEDIPPNWLVWISVDDVKAKADKIRSLGGTIVMEPMDFGGGWTAIAQDPTGATFGVIQMNKPSV
jgi:predicted enzyme related to lactoylglutathione lyase